jgi:hypothetical protein
MKFFDDIILSDHTNIDNSVSDNAYRKNSYNQHNYRFFETLILASVQIFLEFIISAYCMYMYIFILKVQINFSWFLCNICFVDVDRRSTKYKLSENNHYNRYLTASH